MVLANCEDTTNTNITLTVREIAPDAAHRDDRRGRGLGRHPRAEWRDVGAAAEAPARRLSRQSRRHRAGRRRTSSASSTDCRSPSCPRTIRRSRARPSATPDCGSRPASASSVSGSAASCGPPTRTPRFSPTACSSSPGLPSQIAALNAQLPNGDGTPPPVLVIGAGKVGQAAARALKRKGLRVHAIDRTEAALAPIAGDVDAVFAGDAADRRAARARRHSRRALGRADHQRRCDEHLPGGVLPPAEPRAAHRQPHHPRAESRGDSSRRARTSC